jgi:hypothetical protein
MSPSLSRTMDQDKERVAASPVENMSRRSTAAEMRVGTIWEPRRRGRGALALDVQGKLGWWASVGEQSQAEGAVLGQRRCRSTAGGTMSDLGCGRVGKVGAVEEIGEEDDMWVPLSVRLPDNPSPECCFPGVPNSFRV